jgi:hypothetical protein
MAFTVHSSSVNTGFSSSIVVTAPTGITVGDLLIAHGHTNSLAGLDTPSGWTEVADIQFSGAVDIRQQAFSKIADSADASAGNFTFSITGGGTDDLSAGIIRISGHAATDFIDDTTTYAGAVSSGTSTMTATAMSQTSADSLVLWLVGVVTTEGSSSNYTMATSAPSAVEIYDASTASANDQFISSAYGLRSATGTTGNFSCDVTCSTGTNSGSLIGLIIAPSVSDSFSATVQSATFSLSAPTTNSTVEYPATALAPTLTINAPTVTTPNRKFTPQSKPTTVFTNQNIS